MRSSFSKKIFLVVFMMLICSTVFPDETSDLLGNALNGDVSLGDIQKGMTTANIIAWALFGAVGVFVFLYGKNKSNVKLMFIGVFLMVYPYLVHNTLWLFVIGIGLSVVAYFVRK